MTLDERHASEVVIADVLDVVGHFAMVALLCGAVPTRHDLAIVKHLKEIGGIWWVRTVNRVLEPDLRAWIDRHIAGSHRIVARAESGAFLLEGIIGLAWTELWKFSNVELRDDAHVNASKFDHFGLFLDWNLN